MTTIPRLDPYASMLLCGEPTAHVVDYEQHQHRRDCPECFHEFHMYRLAKASGDLTVSSEAGEGE